MNLTELENCLADIPTGELQLIGAIFLSLMEADCIREEFHLQANAMIKRITETISKRDSLTKTN